MNTKKILGSVTDKFFKAAVEIPFHYEPDDPVDDPVDEPVE